jgi:hypothetical protein
MWKLALHCGIMDVVDELKMTQFLFQHYHLEWCTAQKDIGLDPMGMLV